MNATRANQTDSRAHGGPRVINRDEKEAAAPPRHQSVPVLGTQAAGTSAAGHASTLNRATGARPSQAQTSLLQLQRQYGNRHVQRVLALSRQESNGEVAREVETSIQSQRGGGQSLDRGARARMESAFGADFSGVRVHNGPQADSLNRALNARAFTAGQDIFFRKGEYNPGSPSDQELLAHELTHVVQQNGASAIQGKLSVSQPGDGVELEADRVAERVMGIVQSGPSGASDLSRKTDSKVTPHLAILNRGLELARAKHDDAAIDLLQRSVELVASQPNHPMLTRGADLLGPTTAGGANSGGGTCQSCGGNHVARQTQGEGEIHRMEMGQEMVARQDDEGPSTIQCINNLLSSAGIPWAVISIVGGVCGILGAIAGLATGPGAPAASPSAAAVAAAVCIAGVTGLSVGMVLGIIMECIENPNKRWVFS